MTRKHIAGSGQRAVQWVICPAKTRCTLQGTIHVDSSVVEAARQWKQGDEKYTNSHRLFRKNRIEANSFKSEPLTKERTKNTLLNKINNLFKK